MRVRRIRSADTTYCGVKPQSGKAKSFSRSDVWRWVGHVNVPHISQPVASGHIRAHSDTSGQPFRGIQSPDPCRTAADLVRRNPGMAACGGRLSGRFAIPCNTPLSAIMSLLLTFLGSPRHRICPTGSASRLSTRFPRHCPYNPDAGSDSG